MQETQMVTNEGTNMTGSKKCTHKETFRNGNA